MSVFGKLKVLATGAAFAVIAATAGQASVLTFYDDAATQSGQRFTLTCTLGCTAWDGVDFLGTDGDVFTVHPPNDANEIAAVNGITGAAFDASTYSKDNSVGSVFTTSAEYILLKIGGGKTNNVGLVKNLFAGNMFTFSTGDATASGLSHTSYFGTNGDGGTGFEVPLPAGMPLILTALGVFGLVRMRKTG